MESRRTYFDDTLTNRMTVVVDDNGTMSEEPATGNDMHLPLADSSAMHVLLPEEEMSVIHGDNAMVERELTERPEGMETGKACTTVACLSSSTTVACLSSDD